MTAPNDWHPQYWIIVIDALTHWAGPPEETGTRGERAYELIEKIAEEQGLPASELVLQSNRDSHNRPY